MTDRPLYNSRVIHVFVQLVAKKYPRVDVKHVLQDSGIEPYAVNDEGQWFTQSQVNRFYELLVQATGNPDLAREAGQYGASADSLGTMKNYLLGLIGPANAFSSIKKAASNLSKSSIYDSRRIASNKVEITVTPARDVQEGQFQCENRLGFFEAVLTSFGCSIPAIEHPECMFKGGKVCRYQVSWKETPPIRIRAFRNNLALALLLPCAALAPFRPWETLAVSLPVTAFLLSCSHLANHLEKKELHAALASLRESTDVLLEQSWVSYNNARLVNEVGQAISKQTGREEILETVIKALENRLNYDRGLILLADPDQTKLGFRCGFGYSEDQLALLREASFVLTASQPAEVFATCFREQKPILIDGLADASEVHSPRGEFSGIIGAQSFLCCPIVCEGESLGILAVDNSKTNKALAQSDISLLTGIAPVIGMSIRNAMYIDRERERAEQMRQSQKM